MSPPLFFRFYYLLLLPRVSNNLQCPRSIPGPRPVHDGVVSPTHTTAAAASPNPQTNPCEQIARSRQSPIAILFFTPFVHVEFSLITRHAFYMYYFIQFFFFHTRSRNNETRILHTRVYYSDYYVFKFSEHFQKVFHSFR